jgi:hypothetical protein
MMTRLIVVVDARGDIKAAAGIDPESRISPTSIEVKPGESLHEVAIPEELQAEGLENLLSYYVVADVEARLAKRT